MMEHGKRWNREKKIKSQYIHPYNHSVHLSFTVRPRCCVYRIILSHTTKKSNSRSQKYCATKSPNASSILELLEEWSFFVQNQKVTSKQKIFLKEDSKKLQDVANMTPINLDNCIVLTGRNNSTCRLELFPSLLSSWYWSFHFVVSNGQQMMRTTTTKDAAGVVDSRFYCSRVVQEK